MLEVRYDWVCAEEMLPLTRGARSEVEVWLALVARGSSRSSRVAWGRVSWGMGRGGGRQGHTVVWVDEVCFYGVLVVGVGEVGVVGGHFVRRGLRWCPMAEGKCAKGNAMD